MSVYFVQYLKVTVTVQSGTFVLFLQVPEVTLVKSVVNSAQSPINSLVAKLMGCFHHLEQVCVHYRAEQ